MKHCVRCDCGRTIELTIGEPAFSQAVAEGHSVDTPLTKTEVQSRVAGERPPMLQNTSKERLISRHGWRQLRGNLYVAPDGRLRLILSHRAGSWYGISFSAWDSLKKDPLSLVLLTSPSFIYKIPHSQLKILVPTLSRSETSTGSGHYNLRIQDGSVKTKYGDTPIIEIGRNVWVDKY